MDDGAGVFAWCVGWLKNLFESFIVESILSTYNIHYTRYVFKRFSTTEDMNTTIKKPHDYYFQVITATEE